jgi:hypothetical protein
MTYSPGQARIGIRPYTQSYISYLLSSAAAALSTPILDTYSGSGAAYSLRKLKTSYTGPAIRVRRASDNQETNIGFNSSGNLDTTFLLIFATDMVATDSLFVTTWYDQSGNGKNAVQTTASSQPNIVSGGNIRTQGTKPAFYFDGVDDFLDCGYINNGVKPGTFSTWISANITNASQTRNILASGNSGGQGITGYNQFGIHQGVGYKMFGVVGDGNWVNNTESGLYRYYSTSIAPTTNQRYLFEQHYVSNSASTSYLGQFWWNDIRQSVSNWLSTGAVKSSGVEYKTSIGRSGEYTGGGYLQGMIQEIVTYFSDKTSVRKEIVANINSYYSIYTQDTNPLTAAAYSLRKLTTDYTGSAIRVRRSKDNVEMDIPFVNGVIDEATIINFVGYHNATLQSDSMTNVGSVWNYLNGSVSGYSLTLNSITAPDGTLSVSKISEPSGWNNAKVISQATSNTYVIGTSWNTSVHFKMTDSTNQARYMALCNNNTTVVNANDIYVVFDLLDKVVTDSNFSTDTNTGYSIDDLGNGWIRCSIWGTTTQAVTRYQVKVIRGTNNSPSFRYTTYQSVFGRDFYIWGFQYTQGLGTKYLTLKPYTKTTTTHTGFGYMVTWYDQSGNNRHLTQSTAARQSLLITDGFFNLISGKHAVTLSNGSLGAFTLANPDLDTTILMVSQLGSTYIPTTEYQLLGGGTYDNQSKLSIKGNKYFLCNNTVVTTGISSVNDVTTNPTISTVINSTIDKLRINGNEVISGNVGGFNGSTNIIVGSGYLSRHFLGSISEVVVWYNYPKESIINTIESSVNSYYSIY